MPMVDVVWAVAHRGTSPSWLDNEQRSLSLPISLLAVFLFSVLIIHRILLYLGHILLSIKETLWNAFVYAVPSRLVFALKPDASGALRMEEHPSQHALKSEILRNLFTFYRSGHKEIFPVDEVHKRPAGLGNWDNSCYQNSILQAFASLEPLRSFLSSFNPTLAPHSTTQTLLKLIHDLNDTRNCGQRLWTPGPLKSMSSWQQQDAQEYFSKILESVEKDTTTALKNAELQRQSLSLLIRRNLLNVAGGYDYRLRKEQLMPIVPEERGLKIPSRANPLEGLLAQRVGCTRCGYVEGISAIPFNCITLPLGRNDSYDVEDRLDAFTALDSIEGVECASCSLWKAQTQLQRLSSTSTTSKDSSSIDDLDSFIGFKESAISQLAIVTNALDDKDFSESTLLNKCHLRPECRVNSTKSRQAVVLRAPSCLVLHLNRSLFDETAGLQMKNYAEVRYRDILDLTPWCIGVGFHRDVDEVAHYEEKWEVDPAFSMLGRRESLDQQSHAQYHLQAVVTHYGRHENGHYVCYRKLPALLNPSFAGNEHSPKRDWNDFPFKEGSWWRISDDNVSPTTESEALSQAGAFMLFYERANPSDSPGLDLFQCDFTTNQTQKHDTQRERDLDQQDMSKTFLKVEQHEVCDETENQSEPELVLRARASCQDVPTTEAAVKSTKTEYPNQSTKTDKHGLGMNRYSGQPKMRTAGMNNVSEESLAFKAFRLVATT